MECIRQGRDGKPSRRRALTLVAVLWLGCQGAEADAPAGATSPHSERGGVGMGTRSQAVVSPSQVVSARRSLAVTETAILSQFGLPAVLQQLASQSGNPGFTGEQLFRQLWETQNPASAPQRADLQPSAHCADNGGTLNGFPNSCRFTEGAQANPGNFPGLTSYSAIGLFNRFDLAPADGADCGEYRVVYGLPGGGGRNFIILEAILPNPREDLGLEGCRQVQAFWRDLSNTADINARATALRNFYFNGLPGYAPVFHQENYGFNARDAGQVRVNMFMGGAWLLKEFKLKRECPEGVCALKAVPVTVKTNPFGGLFSQGSADPRAADFQNHFLTQVQPLAVNDVNRFNYDVPDRFNAAESDAQSFGVPDDYVERFAGPGAFRDAIQARLTQLGSPLTPDQVVARAQALSCGGCHQRSVGAPLGNGMQFPFSASFVHNTEFIEPGPDGTRFQLSSALTGTFLPFRKSVMEEFLSAEHRVTTNTRFNMVGSAADGTSVYWVENRPSGSLVKASLNSGGERVLAFNRPSPSAVATDGVNVYWVEAGGSLLKVPVNGGAPTSLATGLTGLGGVATDGTHVYWTLGGSLVRMSVNGGAPTVLFANRVGLTGRLAVDGASLYWQEGNTVQKAPKAGGAVTALLSRAAITGLASDGTHLYLAEDVAPGNILRLPVTGGTPAVLFSGQASLTSVAVGPSHFVWTSNTLPGPVMARVKN